MKENEVLYGPYSEPASGILRAVIGTMAISVAHSPIPGLTEAEGLERLVRRLVEYRTDLAATRVAWKRWACCVVLGRPSSQHAGGGLR